MNEPNRMLTAKDIMTHSVITFLPDTSIFQAIRVLLGKRISGAPVVDLEGFVVGMLSELDCLRVISSDEFYAGHQEGEGLVRDFMTPAGLTIKPDMDLFGIAHYFLTNSVRRLPVVDQGRLVGQVSRRDLLRVIEVQAKRRVVTPKQYPDYRGPSLR